MPRRGGRMYPMTKRYDGVTFRNVYVNPKKSAAEKVAEGYRKRGYRARVADLIWTFGVFVRRRRA